MVLHCPPFVYTMSSPKEKILDPRKRARSPSPPNLSSNPRHQKRARIRHDESVQSPPHPEPPSNLGQQQPQGHPHISETRKRPRSPSPEDADGEDERPLSASPQEEFLPPPRLSRKRLRSPSPPVYTHQRRKRRKVGLEGALLVDPKPDKVRVPKRVRSLSPQRSNKGRKLEIIPKSTQAVHHSEEGVEVDVFILVSRLIADKQFSKMFGFYAPEPSNDFYDESSFLPPPTNDPTVPFIVRNRGVVGMWLEQEASLGRLPLTLLLAGTHKRITRRMLKEIWDHHMDEAEQYSYKKCILKLLALYNSRHRPADSKKLAKTYKHIESKLSLRSKRQRHVSASERAQAQPSTSRLSVPDVHTEAESQAPSRFVLVPAHWHEDDYYPAPPPLRPYHHAHEGAYPDLHFPSPIRYPYMLPSSVGDHADWNHDPVTTLNREISAGFPSSSSGVGPSASTAEPYHFPLHVPSSSPSLYWSEVDNQVHYDSGARDVYTYPPIIVRNEHWNAPLLTHNAEDLVTDTAHAAGVSVIQASLKREDSSTAVDDPATAGLSIPREAHVNSPDLPEAESAQSKAECPDTQTERERNVAGPLVSGLLKQEEEAPLCVNPADLTLSASEVEARGKDKDRKDNSGRENSVEAYYERFLDLSWDPLGDYDGPFPPPPGGGDEENYDGPFPLPPFTG